MRNEEPHGPPEPEAPRRQFQFKPTVFEVTNRPAGSTPADAPIDVHQLNRLAASPPPAGGSRRQPENDVHAILKANVAHAQDENEPEIILQPRRLSRRKRDFWLLFTSVNLLVVAAVIGLHKNPVTLVFGFSAMVFFSLGLIWVMWVVMDDY